MLASPAVPFLAADQRDGHEPSSSPASVDAGLTDCCLMLPLTLSDPWLDQIHVRLTIYSIQLEDSLELVEIMFGYAAHTHALTLRAAPGLAKLGSTISVNLQDSGDSIFEDIATSRRDRKRDYQPRKADLVQTTFETPGEQNEYNWS